MVDFLVILVSMVAIVPIAKKLGLGSVLGYLIAGVVIGPQGLKFFGHSEQAASLAEFGVIMMLLLIGLELSPKLLWKMRGPIFGLGSIQVILTTLVVGALGMIAGLPWQAALAAGLIMSPSSTAIVLPTLQERGYAKSVGGERAFAVLLFQDMAVIPMLAIIPFLVGQQVTSSHGHGPGGWTQTGLIAGAVIAVIGVGRFALRPVFAMISRLKLRETFTALALLIVVAAAALMHAVGLSPALGAFLAGVVLANSEYRHQIEADIEPFKGLLLGLFFITVGAGIRFDLVVQNPLPVLFIVLSLIGIKSLLMYGLGRGASLPPPESLLFAISIGQGGEFAFVIISQAAGLFTPDQTQFLTAGVALSMAIAPLLIGFTIKHGMSRLVCMTPEETAVRAPDEIASHDKENPVLVIGIGRFGQTLTRFLTANGVKSTVLDMDSEQIEIMAKFQVKAYFGDGSNLDLLRAAGIENAKALVMAIDEPETALRIAELVRHNYPHLKIFSRAYDRIHAYKLLHLGVNQIAIETSGSALALGQEVMTALGMPAPLVFRKAQIFRKKNDQSIIALSKRYHEMDRENFIQASREMAQQLEAMLKSDATLTHMPQTDQGWDSAPRDNA